MRQAYATPRALATMRRCHSAAMPQRGHFRVDRCNGCVLPLQLSTAATARQKDTTSHRVAWSNSLSRKSASVTPTVNETSSTAIHATQSRREGSRRYLAAAATSAPPPRGGEQPPQGDNTTFPYDDGRLPLRRSGSTHASSPLFGIGAASEGAVTAKAATGNEAFPFAARGNNSSSSVARIIFESARRSGVHLPPPSTATANYNVAIGASGGSSLSPADDGPLPHSPKGAVYADYLRQYHWEHHTRRPGGSLGRAVRALTQALTVVQQTTAGAGGHPDGDTTHFTVQPSPAGRAASPRRSASAAVMPLSRRVELASPASTNPVTFGSMILSSPPPPPSETTTTTTTTTDVSMSLVAALSGGQTIAATVKPSTLAIPLLDISFPPPLPGRRPPSPPKPSSVRAANVVLPRRSEAGTAGTTEASPTVPATSSPQRKSVSLAFLNLPPLPAYRPPVAAQLPSTSKVQEAATSSLPLHRTPAAASDDQSARRTAAAAAAAARPQDDPTAASAATPPRSRNRFAVQEEQRPEYHQQEAVSPTTAAPSSSLAAQPGASAAAQHVVVTMPLPTATVFPSVAPSAAFPFGATPTSSAFASELTSGGFGLPTLGGLASLSVAGLSSSPFGNAAAPSTAAAPDLSHWERLREQQLAQQQEEVARLEREAALKQQRAVLIAAEEAWVASRPKNKKSAPVVNPTLSYMSDLAAWEQSTVSGELCAASVSAAAAAMGTVATVENEGRRPLQWSTCLSALSALLKKPQWQQPNATAAAHLVGNVSAMIGQTVSTADWPFSAHYKYLEWFESLHRSVAAAPQTAAAGSVTVNVVAPLAAPAAEGSDPAGVGGAPSSSLFGAVGLRKYTPMESLHLTLIAARLRTLERLRLWGRFESDFSTLSAAELASLPLPLLCRGVELSTKSDWQHGLAMMLQLKPQIKDPYLKLEYAVGMALRTMSPKAIDHRMRGQLCAALEQHVRSKLSDLGKRHGFSLMAGYGRARRFTEMRRIFKELSDRGDVDECSAGVIMRYTVPEQRAVLLRQWREKGLDVGHPDVVLGMLQHHLDRRDATATYALAKELRVDEAMIEVAGEKLAYLLVGTSLLLAMPPTNLSTTTTTTVRATTLTSSVDLLGMVLRSRAARRVHNATPRFRSMLLRALYHATMFKELVSITKELDLMLISTLPEDVRQHIKTAYRVTDAEPSGDIAQALDAIRPSSAAAVRPSSPRTTRATKRTQADSSKGEAVKKGIPSATATVDAAADGSDASDDAPRGEPEAAALGPVVLPATDKMLEFGKVRNWQAALASLQTIPSVVPREQHATLTLLFNCALSAAVEEPPVVEQLLADMQRRAVMMNTTTYNTAISSFAKAAAASAAAAASSTPSSPTRESSDHQPATQQHWLRSLQLFDSMPYEACDVNTYSVLLTVLARRQLWCEAAACMQSMKALPGAPRPPAAAYGLVVQASHRHSWLVSLRALLELQKQHGVEHVKDVVSSRVVSSMEAAGRGHDAAKLLEHLHTARRRRQQQLASNQKGAGDAGP